jgi:hypothetical protein
MRLEIAARAAQVRVLKSAFSSPRRALTENTQSAQIYQLRMERLRGMHDRR